MNVKQMHLLLSELADLREMLDIRLLQLAKEIQALGIALHHT